MKRPPRRLTECLRRYDPVITWLTYAARALILDELAPCHEHMFVRHVEFAFPRGVDLHDSGGVLRGSGKAFRHVKLTTRSDLERPEIRTLIREARANEVGPFTDRDDAG